MTTSSADSRSFATAQELAKLTPEQQALAIRSLTPAEREQLLHCWRFWARPKQLAPDWLWRYWVVCAGRGFGKTRCGAEWVLERVEKGAKSIAIAGRTARAVRREMVEGESGILRCAPPWNRPEYQPSLCRIIWPNGAVANTYSADEPDSMRGPNTDTVWADELAAWQYIDSWAQLTYTLRSIQSGLPTQACITTTPRALEIVKELLRNPRSAVTRGSTYENAPNLDVDFLADMRLKEGTRQGRQEIFAEILDDALGALWKRPQIDRDRVPEPPQLRNVVVAVDPAVTSGEKSDETGIVVCGLGEDGHGYILADESGKHSTDEWAKLAVELYDEWQASRVICEVNQGGDLVESNLRTVRRELPITKIHASRAKRVRAEPVATLSEQRRIHHVGNFGALEDQMCGWEPDVVEIAGRHKKSPSPDRLDAMVYGITYLMIDRNPERKPVQVRRRLNLSAPFDERTIG